jgi:hypothetical protein
MTIRVERADSGTLGDQPRGGGAHPTSTLPIGKAHQRVIRERGTVQQRLFAPPTPRRAKEGLVREIDYQTAASIILPYEWLGTMPSVPLKCYGLFFAGEIGGAAVFAAEPTENRGVWHRYGYTGKIILLARGACAEWTPPNSASRLIRKSMALLPSRYEIVTATADPAAGEIGTVYQASGFVFVGEMTKRWGGRHYFLVNGKRVGEKTGRVLGLEGAAGVTRVESQSKLRYFAFRGPDVNAHRAAIAHLVQPYPKREGAA